MTNDFKIGQKLMIMISKFENKLKNELIFIIRNKMTLKRLRAVAKPLKIKIIFIMALDKSF